MREDLVILGDSWGCGSFSTPNGVITGAGDYYFQKQLGKKYNIVNFAGGGLSNARTISRLADYLHMLDHMKSDLNKVKFLVIQTDPIRDFYPTFEYHLISSNFYDIFKNGNLKEFAEIQTELFYYQLQVLSEKYNIKVNIIGGCSDVHPSVLKYKNLNVLCFSWFQLIDKNHKLGVFSNTTTLGQIIKINSDDDGKIIDQIYEKQIIVDREQGNYFGYSGDNHPSHLGQDLMINLIIDKL
jgi:hypothetical protein